MLSSCSCSVATSLSLCSIFMQISRLKLLNVNVCSATVLHLAVVPYPLQMISLVLRTWVCWQQFALASIDMRNRSFDLLAWMTVACLWFDPASTKTSGDSISCWCCEGQFLLVLVEDLYFLCNDFPNHKHSCVRTMLRIMMTYIRVADTAIVVVGKQ